jgi:hypothetical protein
VSSTNAGPYGERSVFSTSIPGVIPDISVPFSELRIDEIGGCMTVPISKGEWVAEGKLERKLKLEAKGQKTCRATTGG